MFIVQGGNIREGGKCTIKSLGTQMKLEVGSREKCWLLIEGWYEVDKGYVERVVQWYFHARGKVNNCTK